MTLKLLQVNFWDDCLVSNLLGHGDRDSAMGDAPVRPLLRVDSAVLDQALRVHELLTADLTLRLGRPASLPPARPAGTRAK